MRIPLSRFLVFIGVLVILSAIAGSGLAQGDSGQCPALVKQALTELGQNCDALDRNSACYGYNRVDATFADTIAEDFFHEPADRAGLAQLQSLATAPLDEAKEYWGIAVLNVQANIPNTLPGQAVTFIMLGDTEVENAVPADEAVEPGEPINLTTSVAANLRSGPSTNANVVGSLPSGSPLVADGKSADGEWLRIVYAGGPAWVNTSVVSAESDTSALQVISKQNRSPMQAFYFRTAIGDTQCNEAPSLLVVQGPNSVKVNINANGADITIGSTIVLRILPGNIAQLMVVSGEATLGGLVVPAGFTVTAPLSPDGKTLVGDWGSFRPLSQEELDDLQTLENIPPNLLHYPIVIPTAEEIQAALELFAQGATSSNPLTLGAAASQVKCDAFKLTSPLGAWGQVSTTFYWDAAVGATSYRLHTPEGTVETASTNATVNLSNTNVDNLSWSVDAMVGDQIACTAGPVTLIRDISLKSTPVPATASPAPVCGNYICEAGETYYTCSLDCYLP